MVNTAIIYYSKHHNNTKKLLDGIKDEFSADLYDITGKVKIDLGRYKIIGFASGIYMSKFSEDITEFIEENGSNLTGKKTFIIYTCGSFREKYEEYIKKLVQAKGMKLLGTFHSLGLDTFGPFKLIGGISKGHPTEEEVQKCIEFYKEKIESKL